MARPKKQFPPKKEYRITICMTEDMYFVVAREVERAGLSISGKAEKIDGKRRQAVHIEYDLIGYIPLEELVKEVQA